MGCASQGIRVSSGVLLLLRDSSMRCSHSRSKGDFGRSRLVLVHAPVYAPCLQMCARELAKSQWFEDVQDVKRVLFFMHNRSSPSPPSTGSRSKWQGSDDLPTHRLAAAHSGGPTRHNKLCSCCLLFVCTALASVTPLLPCLSMNQCDNEVNTLEVAVISQNGMFMLLTTPLPCRL